MANSLGKTSGNILVWILMVLLVVGLGGFGVSNFGGSVQSIGTVGDQEISVTAYSRELQQDLRAIEAQTGQSMPLSQAQAFGVDQGVIQRLVANAAVDNETAQIGLSAGDETVREQVLAIPAFNALDGSFDREAYRQALSRAGLTETEFEESIRKDAARGLVQRAVTGGVVAPETYTKTLLDFVGERRNFTWARLEKSDLTAPIGTPTEAQLTEYYTANAAAFTIPEAKRITYAWMRPEDMLDTTPVDEAALRTLYDERKAEYQNPEHRLIERLVFPTEDAAADAKARLDAGTADFETLVAERGLTLDDIDMGDLGISDLGDAGAAIFALTEPGVVGPLPSSLGPALFRMNGILEAQNVPFEEARDALVEEYAIDAARRRVDTEIEPIDNLLVGGATLEEVAKETGMTLGTIDWYDGQKNGLAAYDTFAEAAAKLTADDYPEVIRLDDGGIFAMRLDEIVPPTLRPMEEVRADVVSGWETAETGAQLAKLAEGMIPQIEGGADMASLGLTAVIEQDMTREAFIQDTPSDFMRTVFAMEKGALKQVAGFGAVYLVQLDDILPPDAENADFVAAKTALTTQAAQDVAQDAFDMFTRSLTASAGLSLNQTAINAVHAQFP